MYFELFNRYHESTIFVWDRGSTNYTNKHIRKPLLTLPIGTNRAEHAYCKY